MDIQQALNPRLKSLSQQEKPSRVATITHMQTTFNHISRLLTRINIKTTHSYKKECWHFETGET
jgi:phosphopantetheinyl transferase